jgi:hypothetical protein
MDIKDLLSRLDIINEAATPAQQAAIAINMKKQHKRPKHEGATGPKFTGYWKGTDAGTPGTKMVGSSESILRDLERRLDETPVRDLMAEYRQFIAEYGGVGGYGAASQAPTGTTGTEKDPADLQKAADATQIQKNTNAIAPTLNAQGAAQQLNKVKFQDVMNKLDDKSNQELQGADLKQLQPLAVAASKALQNPQTAGQLKQVIAKAGQLDQKKELEVKQAQQTVGTNAPAGQQPAQSPKPAGTP